MTLPEEMEGLGEGKRRAAGEGKERDHTCAAHSCTLFGSSDLRPSASLLLFEVSGLAPVAIHVNSLAVREETNPQLLVQGAGGLS